MEKVSIIVPLYNTERYIEKCLRSLLSQTYPDMEIIVVDDGSTDKSRQLVLNLLNEDSRIKLFCQNNGGVSAARNTGLKYAEGSVIGFVDSDDWVEPRFVELLMEDLKDHDIALCGFNTPGRISHSYGMDLSIKSVDEKQYLSDMLKVKNCTFTIVNKLFRKEIIGDNRFIEQVQYEDMIFSYQTGLAAKRIHYRAEKLYNYYTRPDSYVNTSSEKRAREYVFAIDYVIKLLDRTNLIEELKEETQYFLLKDLYFMTNLYQKTLISNEAFLEGSKRIIDLYHSVS